MRGTESAGADSKFIERLSFGKENCYEGIEAAIHLGRYLVAQPFCEGRRVLDVACGEGYGAYLLAERWNAASVAAVDLSAEAIEAAGAFFRSDRIEYRQGAAERIHELYEEAEFDLIVSLETIEHLDDPRAFLKGAARLLKPGGVIIISCPNDHWYYRTPEEHNPFHIRKYTLEEFRELTESTLGPASSFLLGAPIAGFAAFADPTLAGRSEASPRLMMEARIPSRAVLLPSEEDVNASNCRYYIGVWGASSEELTLVTAFPTTMDQSAAAIRQAQLESQRDEIRRLRTRLYEMEGLTLSEGAGESRSSASEPEGLIENLRRQARKSGLRAAALAAENEFLREQFAPLLMDGEPLRDRYAKLADLNREQRQALDDCQAFIRHLESTIENCHRELNKSPFHRLKQLAGRMLKRSRRES